ncbi:MAG: hypothetical protein CMM53_01580 [Rhodospirillaceae bacterium]|nr:hypothetical protein [Rhodospirillaceae bacterium]
MSKGQLLKLRANDKEDLAVISTVLQDSLITANEMLFLKKEFRFAFVANRFRWEDNNEKKLEDIPVYERVHCGICFDTVTNVRQKGLDQYRKSQIISLLSIVAEKNIIDMSFSAGIVVRLEIDEILCHLQDLDSPWPTKWRPKHRLEKG